MQWYAGLTPSQILFSFSTGKCGLTPTGSLNGSLSNVSVALLNPSEVTCVPTADQLNTGQTVTFISIVLLQFYILSTRTNYHSFFSTAPWHPASRNLYLFAGQAVTICIMILVVFLPPINQLFLTSPPQAQFFFLPLVCAAIIFGVDEARKYFVRRKLFYFHKWAW